MRKFLLVVVVIVLLALPATTVGAQRYAPLWHCDTVRVDASSPGYNVTATGAGNYWRIKQVGGSTIAGPQQSPAFHHIGLVEGAQYQVQAADAYGGPWSNDASCVFTVTPLAVVIFDFTAICAPGGVMLSWSVSTELFSTRYSIARNGETILDVPADCPGCVPAAAYSETVLLPDAHGIYTLQVYNGDALIDVEETWLASCVPTAVRLSRFSAR